MPIHPTIRVCLLIVLAAVLPVLGFIEVYGLWLILMAALMLIGVATVRRAGSFIWRSRWLLASIALVYLAFTPGQPLFDALPGISREGLSEALRRIGILLVLLSAVVCLQATTSTACLSAAIIQLLGPLRWFGLDPGIFALRLGLAMEYVTQPQRQRALTVSGNWLDRAAQGIKQIESAAVNETAVPATIPAMETPPPWQWLLPLGLLSGALAWAH